MNVWDHILATAGPALIVAALWLVLRKDRWDKWKR